MIHIQYSIAIRYSISTPPECSLQRPVTHVVTRNVDKPFEREICAFSTVCIVLLLAMGQHSALHNYAIDTRSTQHLHCASLLPGAGSMTPGTIKADDAVRLHAHSVQRIAHRARSGPAMRRRVCARVSMGRQLLAHVCLACSHMLAARGSRL